MDNVIFDVNGSGSKMLLETLKLAFMQCGKYRRCEAYSIDSQNGLILYWSDTQSGENIVKGFPPMEAEDCMPIVNDFLKNIPDNMEYKGWDIDQGHDGHNTKGWRVYTESWGMVSDKTYSFIAIKPAYMWHGK